MSSRSRTVITAKKKLRAIARAQRRLSNRLADIEWEEQLDDALKTLEYKITEGEQVDLYTDGNIVEEVRRLGLESGE